MQVKRRKSPKKHVAAVVVVFIALQATNSATVSGWPPACTPTPAGWAPSPPAR